MPSFYLFMTFSSEVKQMWHKYKYVLKHPFKQDMYNCIFKQQTEMSYLFRDYFLTLALFIYIREFKHMWYQIYKADYCLKHFKIVWC